MNPADKTVLYLREVARLQHILARAVNHSSCVGSWYAWFNLFDANCNLIQDEAPGASLVNCRLARGISLHIYLPDDKPGGWHRWADCRTFAEGTDDEIDHLVISGTRDRLDEDDVTELILEWLRVPKDDNKARQKLNDSFSIKRKGKRAAS